MVLVSMGNFVVRPFPATHPIWALTIVNLIQHRGFNYFSICTHKHKKLDIMWETRYMPPPVLILWLANWKQWFSFYWSFWRLLYLCLFTGPQSKPSFTLFEGSISSKVMCTHHSSAVGGYSLGTPNHQGSGHFCWRLIALPMQQMWNDKII
jgi:hypothetical protein